MSVNPALRWCAGVLLALYAVVIARLTLAPAASESGTFGLLQRLTSHASGGRLDWSQTEVLANVALFVPAGLLLSFVLRRAWLAAVICIMVSAAIELAQRHYLPSRVPSLADVEHNGLGAIIGALLAWLVLQIAQKARGQRHGVHHDGCAVHYVDLRSG